MRLKTCASCSLKEGNQLLTSNKTPTSDLILFADFLGCKGSIFIILLGLVFSTWSLSLTLNNATVPLLPVTCQHATPLWTYSDCRMSKVLASLVGAVALSAGNYSGHFASAWQFQIFNALLLFKFSTITANSDLRSITWMFLS